MTEGDKITIREAYAATYRYLQRHYELTGADEVGALLGSMSLLPDGRSADPAAWSAWVQAVEDLRAGVVDADLALNPTRTRGSRP